VKHPIYSQRLRPRPHTIST